MGLPDGDEGAVASLLNSDLSTGEQLVEMLLPLLWLRHPNEVTGNLCVDSSIVLQHAFAMLGVDADVRPVDLVIANQASGKHTMYGRPDPYWDGTNFNGHCVLSLPQSGRMLDTTVEQFPEARRPGWGPVLGRIAFSAGGSASQASSVARGQLPDGGTMGVQRDKLLLLYTVTSSDYRDVVSSAPAVQQATEEYHRAGTNLASHALTLLRIPDISAKVPRDRYPRIHELLNVIGRGEFITDRSGDFYFILPVEGADKPVRLGEIQPSAPVDTPPPATTKLAIPHIGFDTKTVKSILKDVDTEARIILHPTEAMGGGKVPVVVFSPRFAVAMLHQEGESVEAQSEGLIAAGFARFNEQATGLPHLPSWSVRRTRTGLELWGAGGLWARAKLALDDAWLAAASSHGIVRVIYGVWVGVRAPNATSSYTDAERDAELVASRGKGIVAIAEVPWASGPIMSGFQRRLRQLWRRDR